MRFSINPYAPEPSYAKRILHKSKHGPKALGARGQVEHRLRQTFERLYAAQRAIENLHTAQVWFRFMNALIYGWY